jgi:hypothetical protein
MTILSKRFSRNSNGVTGFSGIMFGTSMMFATFLVMFFMLTFLLTNGAAGGIFHGLDRMAAGVSNGSQTERSYYH